MIQILSRRSRWLRLVGLAMSFAVIATATPTSAGLKDKITFRRTVGVGFLGGGVVLAQLGFDYNDEADEFYGRYEAAVDPDEIDRLYQRTSNRDVKSQMSWALAAAFGVAGLRLLFTGHDQLEGRTAASTHAAVKESPVPATRLTPIVEPGRIGLGLNRSFF